MASSFSLLLRLSLLLAVATVSITARPGRPFHPCNTLILFSTTTTTLSHPHFNHHHNHQLIHPQTLDFSGPRSITIFFTRSVNRPEHILHDPIERQLPDDTLFGDSFYDRSMDILKVVGSLLFGVVCGMLTASTMYLLWSLFSTSRFENEDDLSDYEDDDVAAVRKGVYVAIPSKEFSAAKEVPAAKEGMLTALTMYLVWSLFSPPRFEESEDGFDSDFEDDEVAAAKKGVSVAIPSAKEVPAAKEGVYVAIPAKEVA